MRCLIVVAFVIIVPVQSEAQSNADNPLASRSVTVTAGGGQSMGWLGVQGERYLHSARFSVFGAVGYLPESEPGDTSGFAFAGGVRAFTSGAKHRGFLEFSVSPITYELACFDDCQSYYGPALQGGYQFVSSGGFTVLASYGVGYAPGVPAGEDKVNGVIIGVAAGYTWRR